MSKDFIDGLAIGALSALALNAACTAAVMWWLWRVLARDARAADDKGNGNES